MKSLVLTMYLLLITAVCFGQSTKLKPGFIKAEYLELLKISSRQGDTLYDPKLPAPTKSNMVYRSKITGLDNRWDLWLSDDSIAVISIRGTTMQTESWMENLYAAMVPAKGKLNLSNTFEFNYNLSDNPNAAVHIGWLIGTAYLAKDIIPKIDSCFNNGIRDFLIMGHSQGGAIAYLLTSHLENQKQIGILDNSIQFKTYCSAAPKPGNLYYAYEFESMTQDGWAFYVVNAADWVPETPFTIQTTDDFYKINPFTNAKAIIKNAPFPKNIELRYSYNQLTKPSKKASKKFQKYLGKIMSKYIKKYLPEFTPPNYYNSTDYVRTGHTIVLQTDEEYYKLFPDEEGKLWRHHLFEPYIYLTEQLR